MNYVKIRLMGLGLIALSVFIIVLSFDIIFLGIKINIGNFKLSDYFIKILNFLIILGVFGYLGYVGYIMLTTGSRRR